MLVLDAVSKTIDGFELRNVSFAVNTGDYFVLLGESGAGKTVLLELICGLLQPDSGRIMMGADSINHQPVQKHNMGLVYQDHALFPHMSVARNVAYPLTCRSFAGDHSTEVTRLLELVGASCLHDRSPETLSLGEKQRVALARALATQPSVLLLDEPLASLDVQSKTMIRSLLRRLNQEGQTIVHVTHDYDEAIALADSIAVLEGSTIAQTGSPEDIFQHPKTQFVANFAGIRNFFKGDFTRDDEMVGTFRAGNLSFEVASDIGDGFACAIIRSEDITVSRERISSSARNQFQGTVVDIEPAHLGIDVFVDIGETMVSTITKGSFERMEIKPGDALWLSFKASAVRLLKE